MSCGMNDFRKGRTIIELLDIRESLETKYVCGSGSKVEGMEQ